MSVLIEVRVVSYADGFMVETTADGGIFHSIGPFADFDTAKLIAQEAGDRARRAAGRRN